MDRRDLLWCGRLAGSRGIAARPLRPAPRRGATIPARMGHAVMARLSVVVPPRGLDPMVVPVRRGMGRGLLPLLPCQFVVDRLVGDDEGVADPSVERLQVVLQEPVFEFDVDIAGGPDRAVVFEAELAADADVQRRFPWIETPPSPRGKILRISPQ